MMQIIKFFLSYPQYYKRKFNQLKQEIHSLKTDKDSLKPHYAHIMNY